MEITVSGSLYYNKNYSFHTHSEGLYVSIKFREKGKIFRTELKESILVYDPDMGGIDGYVDNYVDFLNRLEYLAENKSIIYNKVEDAVKEHFKHKQKDEDKDTRLEKALSKFDDMSSFKVKVKIK